MVCPVSTSGMLVACRNGPSDVTRFVALTPFSPAGFSWAIADACQPPAATASATATATNALRIIDLLSPSVLRAPLSFDGRSGDAADELVEEEVVHDRDGNADQQRAGHERSPEIDVAPDELRRHAERHRLLVGYRHERERVQEVLHRERERKDDRGDE